MANLRWLRVKARGGFNASSRRWRWLGRAPPVRTRCGKDGDNVLAAQVLPTSVPLPHAAWQPTTHSALTARENGEARTIKAGFSLQDLLRERRHAKLGHLLPMFPIEQAVEPGVSALPLR